MTSATIGTLAVHFRRPAHTKPVKGRKDVGLDGDGRYTAEASAAGYWHMEVGYGVGETPADARKSAYTHLARLLHRS